MLESFKNLNPSLCYFERLWLLKLERLKAGAEFAGPIAFIESRGNAWTGRAPNARSCVETLQSHPWISPESDVEYQLDALENLSSTGLTSTVGI